MGDITVWDEIRFPFDPFLKDEVSLGELDVGHSDRAADQEVRETYTCDAGGAVTVTIANLSSDYERSFRLGRWAVPGKPLVPGKRKKRAAKRKRAKS